MDEKECNASSRRRVVGGVGIDLRGDPTRDSCLRRGPALGPFRAPSRARVGSVS